MDIYYDDVIGALWRIKFFHSIYMQISVLNFMYMFFVAIGRSLLIFSDVSFKMADCFFSDSNFSFALNIYFKFQ